MANRFWRGGTGTWDASDTTHWSTSSGGGGGASVPTASDDVFFDANSFSGIGQTVTLSDTRPCNSLDFSAVTNTPQLYFSGFSTCQINIFGNLTLAASMTLTTDSSGAGFYMQANSGSKTIDTKGLSFDGTLDIVGTGIFTLAGVVNFAIFLNEVGSGTFNTANYAMTVQNFSQGGGTINAGISTITVTGNPGDTPFQANWYIQPSPPNAVFNGGSCLINLTFVVSSRFTSSNQTYGTVVFDTHNATKLSISGPSGMSMNKLQLNPGQELEFDGNFDGQFTIGTFVANGLSTDFITIHTDGDPDQFDLSAGSVSLSYLAVQGGNALGAASPFVVAHGTDNGNNTNWLFSSGPAPTFTNTPGAYNPSAFGNAANNQKPNGSTILQRKPQGGSIKTGKPNLA